MTKQDFEDLGNGVHNLKIISTGETLIVEIKKNVIRDTFKIQMKRNYPIQEYIIFYQSEYGIEMYHTFGGFFFEINYKYEDLFLIVN